MKAPPAAAESWLGGAELVVIGGGLLGGALARVATAAGARVTVASPTERPHAGFWRRHEAGAGPFPAWIPRDARVVVAIAPRPGQSPDSAWGAGTQRLLTSLARGGRRVTVCGPSAGAPVFDALVAAQAEIEVVRVTPLFGNDDRLTAPLVRALREGSSGRIPRRAPPVWALWVDDAARAILRGSGSRTLRGPERLTDELIAGAIADRYGGTWGRGWGRADWRAEDLAAAEAQVDVPDAWDDTSDGARVTLRVWADRLPGPRRRR